MGRTPVVNAEAVALKVHVLIPDRTRHTSVTTQRADTTPKTAASTQNVPNCHERGGHDEDRQRQTPHHEPDDHQGP